MEIINEIERAITLLEPKALSIKVVDADSYILAGDFFTMLLAEEKRIKDLFDPLCDKANIAHKALTSARANALLKIKPLKDYIGKEQITWWQAEEDKRRVEEKRLRQEALKREEEERLATALELEKEGYQEEAKAVISEPVYVPPPIVEKTQPKMAGLGIRTTWEAIVIDKMLLIKAVAAGQAPLEAIEPNQTFLNNQARNLKGNMKYPGVVAKEDKKMGGVRT